MRLKTRGENMEINKLIGQFLEANVYIVSKDNECLIVDGGAFLYDTIKAVGKNKVVGILLTHGHYDHSCHVAEYAKFFGCKVYASAEVVKTLTDAKALYSEHGETIEDLSRFEYIDEDKTIKIGNFSVECFHCPGHSPCCECYLVDGENLFSGDVLFDKSIGRTDLIGSNKEDMYKSLCKLENVKFSHCYSGHGEKSDYAMQMKNITVFKRFLTR